MKNLIKNRRGIAVEMAVVVMLIFVALSIVLMSISEMQVDHRVSDLSDFDRKTELYEITDYIKEKHTTWSGDQANEYVYPESANQEVDEYYIINETQTWDKTDNTKISETTYTVSYENKPVLTIKIDNNGKISSWED